MRSSYCRPPTDITDQLELKYWHTQWLRMRKMSLSVISEVVTTTRHKSEVLQAKTCWTYKNTWKEHVPDRVTQQTHLEFCTEILVSFVVHWTMQGRWSKRRADPPYRVRRLRNRPKALRILRVPKWGLCSGIRCRLTQWLERDASRQRSRLIFIRRIWPPKIRSLRWFGNVGQLSPTDASSYPRRTTTNA